MAALRSNQDTTGERCAEPALRHRVATAALTPRARRCIAPVLPPCTVSAVQFSSLTFSTCGAVREPPLRLPAIATLLNAEP
jgi:hypothetical protein